jgi:hypothetical protein
MGFPDQKEEGLKLFCEDSPSGTANESGCISRDTGSIVLNDSPARASGAESVNTQGVHLQQALVRSIQGLSVIAGLAVCERK